MRAFLALPTPRPSRAGFRWERAEDHLTLHFFDRLAEEEVPLVLAAAQEASAGHRPIPFVLRGIGAFPDRRRPRVIWAGVGEGAEPIRALAEALRQALGRRGFPVETRPFAPHVTLFRVRGEPERREAERLLAEPALGSAELGRGTADVIELVESRLGPAGAARTVRASVPLSEARAEAAGAGREPS